MKTKNVCIGGAEWSANEGVLICSRYGGICENEGNCNTCVYFIEYNSPCFFCAEKHICAFACEERCMYDAHVADLQK